MTTTSSSTTETQTLAKKLITAPSSVNILLLQGNLGAGKTTFIKGVAKALQIPERKVKSPTYTLERIHQTQHPTIKNLHHFDLYRLNEVDESIIERINNLATTPSNLIAIEWPEKIQHHLENNYHLIDFKHITEDQRQITITTHET